MIRTNIMRTSGTSRTYITGGRPRRLRPPSGRCDCSCAQFTLPITPGNCCLTRDSFAGVDPRLTPHNASYETVVLLYNTMMSGFGCGIQLHIASGAAQLLDCMVGCIHLRTDVGICGNNLPCRIHTRVRYNTIDFCFVSACFSVTAWPAAAGEVHATAGAPAAAVLRQVRRRLERTSRHPGVLGGFPRPARACSDIGECALLNQPYYRNT